MGIVFISSTTVLVLNVLNVTFIHVSCYNYETCEISRFPIRFEVASAYFNIGLIMK